MKDDSRIVSVVMTLTEFKAMTIQKLAAMLGHQVQFVDKDKNNPTL